MHMKFELNPPRSSFDQDQTILTRMESVDCNLSLIIDRKENRMLKNSATTSDRMNEKKKKATNHKIKDTEKNYNLELTLDRQRLNIKSRAIFRHEDDVSFTQTCPMDITIF